MSNNTYGCVIEGCKGVGNLNRKGEYYFRRGYCQMHYKRNYLYGDVNFIKRKGVSGNSKHELYGVYISMKQRCKNPNSQRYKNYGGRGISVCERWLGVNGFTNFCNDMGIRPDGHSLDRIDVNGNYEPSNCKWSTKHEQAANKTNSIVIVGVRKNKNVNSWNAYLSVGGKSVLCKNFKNKEDAINTRKEAEKIYLNNN